MSAGRSYLTVTCSAGVGCVQAGDTPAALVSRADAALYRAKHEGRNRVAGPEGRTVSLVPKRVQAGRRETA
jgi:diguanylate cyclase